MSLLAEPAARRSWMACSCSTSKAARARSNAVERIAADERHTDLKVLERRAVPRRMFGAWSMAMLDWVDETKMIFQSFSPDADFDLSQTDPTTAAPLFRAWAATSHWHNGEVLSGE
ncbi:MAG: BLUF domain-containing protein [Variovorax sp.]